MRQKTKGAIIRSKARWREQGERNTRYLFNLEKRNQSRKAVTKLKVGDATFDQFEMLEEEKRFYETLYRPENIDEQSLSGSTFFKSENISPLKEEEIQMCEGLVSENECLNQGGKATSHTFP